MILVTGMPDCRRGSDRSGAEWKRELFKCQETMRVDLSRFGYVDRWAVVLAMALVAASAHCAAAATACEPPRIVEQVYFAQDAIALEAQQRARLGSAVERASAYALRYVLVEPRVAETEGTPAERRKLAIERSEYIKAFLAAAGIGPNLVQSALTRALSPIAGRADQPARRSASVALIVSNREGTGGCPAGGSVPGLGSAAGGQAKSR